jgi:hypothetical protein
MREIDYAHSSMLDNHRVRWDIVSMNIECQLFSNDDSVELTYRWIMVN